MRDVIPEASTSSATMAESGAAIAAADASHVPSPAGSAALDRAPVRQTMPESTAERHDLGSYLMVIPWDLQWPGGVNEVVRSLDRELRRDGAVRPLVLVCDWEHRRPNLYGGTPAVIRYRLREPGGPLANPRAFIAWLLTLPPTLLALRRMLMTQQVKVINVHYPTLSSVVFAVMKAWGLTRARLVLSFHGTDAVLAARLSGWQRRLFRFMLSRADVITACSHGFARQVRSLCPAECQAVEAVHNGIDADALEKELAADPAVLPALPGARYLLCVTSYVAKKALDVLIDAFGRVSREHPDLHLVIAGRSGPEFPRVRERVAASGLADRVRLLIDVSHAEVTRWMRGATMFVLPSREEAFGIVLLEAGLAKLPVVATQVGGVPEVISSPQLGVLVPPDDAAALAGAISTLLTDPQRSAAIGARLSEHVRHRFSARACACRYLQLALPQWSESRR